MNPNQSPVGPDRPFKKEFLEAKFSFSFTRKQIIILVNAIAPMQLPIGDMRNEELLSIFNEFKRTALNPITENDYEPSPEPATEPLPEAPKVQTN